MHEVGIPQYGTQLVTAAKVVIVEDGPPEVFDTTGNVPPLVILDLVAHEAQQPVENDGFVLQTIHDTIHGFREDFRVVQLDLQIGRQPQLVRQATEHRLEEGIDGLDAEVAVVV